MNFMGMGKGMWRDRPDLWMVITGIAIFMWAICRPIVEEQNSAFGRPGTLLALVLGPYLILAYRNIGPMIEPILK
jgi:hypothetical protein